MLGFAKRLKSLLPLLNMVLGGVGFLLLLSFLAYNWIPNILISAVFPHGGRSETVGQLLVSYHYLDLGDYVDVTGQRFLLAGAVLLVLFFSGLGLQRSRRWSRVLTLALAVLMGVAGLGSWYYEIAVARPRAEKVGQIYADTDPYVLKSPDGKIVLYCGRTWPSRTTGSFSGKAIALSSPRFCFHFMGLACWPSY
jgi:hypothetical protein